MTDDVGLLGWLAERARQQDTITCYCIAGDGACQKDDEGQLALGLLAEMADSAGQHNTITASLAIAPARRMKIGS